MGGAGEIGGNKREKWCNRSPVSGHGMGRNLGEPMTHSTITGGVIPYQVFIFPDTRACAEKSYTNVVVFLISPHSPPFFPPLWSPIHHPHPPKVAFFWGSHQGFSIFPHISTKIVTFPPILPIFPILAHF